jgi:hypothetical protein
MSTSIINSFNSWSRLEEVWLGDIYPCQWYDHHPSEIRDVFYQLTEITKEDLKIIQQKIESFGVTVRRPTYVSIDSYLDSNDQLVKPQICPRDQFVILGNSLVAHKWHTVPWQQVLDEYGQDQTCRIILTDNTHLNGANIVRLGDRLIIDTPEPKNIKEDYLKNYKVDVVTNGGHLDGCFAILKPGLILASNYFSDYDTFFPGWQKIILTKPEFSMHTKSRVNGKWWLPSVKVNRSFSDHIIKHAQTWIGNYTETYFDLNCLVIDETNVLMLGQNLVLEKRLKEHGITVHWVPFRTRSFWDGGLHCLTVDIRRNSKELAQ